MSPLLPLILLLLGTVGLLIGLRPSFRYTGLIAILYALAALIGLLVVGFRLPARATLSNWGPAALLPVPLSLEVDRLAWLFGLSILTVTLATLLTGVARPGGRRIVVRGAILLLAAAGLAAMFAGNLLTRIMGWAGLDLIYFLALILLAEGEGLEPQAVLNLAFNSTGTLLALGAALLISRTSATLSLRDAVLTPQSTLLITLAAIFRLGLFPLHLGLPTEFTVRQGLGVMLRLIPAAVALEMVSRLVIFGFAEPVRPWLTLFGLVATLVGAAQLWNADDPKQGITYLVISQSGLALLAGLWGGRWAVAAFTAQSLALILGGALVFLSQGHVARRAWLTLLPIIGVAAIVGAPLTIGFLGMSGLYTGLLRSGFWLILVGAGVILAQVILVAGLLLVVFWPGEEEDREPLVRAAYTSGLAFPAVFLVLTGLLGGFISSALGAPSSGFLGFPSNILSGLLALGLVLLTLAAGVGLWRFEALAHSTADTAWIALASLARLDALYRSAWNIVHLFSRIILNLAEVLEGEGALLWTLVAVLLAWLLLK